MQIQLVPRRVRFDSQVLSRGRDVCKVLGAPPGFLWAYLILSYGIRRVRKRVRVTWTANAALFTMVCGVFLAEVCPVAFTVGYLDTIFLFDGKALSWWPWLRWTYRCLECHVLDLSRSISRRWFVSTPQALHSAPRPIQSCTWCRQDVTDSRDFCRWSWAA